MNDLLEKLQEAISETERIALAAIAQDDASEPGVWHVGGDSSYVGRPSYFDASVRSDSSLIADVEPVEAEHIAHNDPKRVLRRVARDRKLLERHERVWLELPWAKAHFCRRCSVPSIDVNVEWPCDDIRDLAEDYEIEVES